MSHLHRPQVRCCEERSLRRGNPLFQEEIASQRALAMTCKTTPCAAYALREWIEASGAWKAGNRVNSIHIWNGTVRDIIGR